MVEILRALVEGPSGIRLAVLAGIDGMIVASARGDDDAPPADLLAASLADVFRKVAAAHDEAGLGATAELTAASPQGEVVLRAVTPDYLLIALAAPGGNFGRIRFELRKAGVKLVPELV